MAYYFLRRYSDGVDACDRALTRNPGRNTQMLTHPTLAATYAELGRQRDADGERAFVARLWPFFDARIFAAQFGTQEARDHMLEGLKKGWSSLSAAALRETGDSLIKTRDKYDYKLTL